MSALLFLWLLFVATPAISKPTGSSTNKRQEDGQAVAGRLSPQSIPEKFLQIAHKECQGPEGQPGTCMFNFECQRQRGQVIGACLDGFLFGACCHVSADQSMSAVLVSTIQAVNSSVASLATGSSSTSNIPFIPTVTKQQTASVGLLNSTASETFNSNLETLSGQSEKEGSYELPLVQIFKNDSKLVNDQVLPVHSQSPTFLSNVEHEKHISPFIRQDVDASSAFISADDTQPITAVIDNQISMSSVENTPTTTGSVVLNKKDPELQAQLTALLEAYTQSSDLINPVSSFPATTTTRVPVRNKPNKRPRPTSTTTSTTSTTPANLVENLSDPEDEISSVTESLADQQANVLQFLVSNPPAWVLDEIINGTALTTWYPLPIPEDIPGLLVDQSAEIVTPSPSSSTSTGTKPPKRKPSKNRPQTVNRITTTTAPAVSQMEAINDTASTTASTATSSMVVEETTASTTTTKKPKQVFDYTKDCGVRPLAPEARIVGGRRADYGRWPWQVLIRESTWFGIFSKNKCGGVLISDRHVLTAAHCQPGFLGSLLVVLGEFDLTGHSEPNTPMEKNVKRVVVHRDYVERTFENDLAILELESPVEFKPYVVPICLPSTSEGDFVGQKAEVTGWGKLSHNGPTPGILYEVDVPVMSNQECHNMFKKAGHEKRILDSFVCAGYAEGKKDSCEGDSGGPLMMERDDGRWSLIGTVSHGIRCAYPNMPGVYMRMTYYRPWIERVTGIGGSQLGK